MMGEAIEFRVFGSPRPGGSKKFFGLSKAGKPIISDAGGKNNRIWRECVKAAVEAVYGKKPLLRGAIALNCVFIMPRPLAHYRKGKRAGELRATAPYYHTKIPDGLKLRRSTEDALTGTIWRDDSQVVIGHEEKIYGEKPGAIITIQEIENAMMTEGGG